MKIKTPKTPEIITGKIDTISKQGNGVLYTDSGPVYVPYSVAGDEVDVRIVKTAATYKIGRLVRLIKRGEGRRLSACLHHARCGGCQLDQIELAKQIELKGRWLKESLDAAGIQSPIRSWIISPETEFRNRIQLSVVEVGGTLRLGLNRLHSAVIEPIDSCVRQDPKIQAAIPRFEAFINQVPRNCDWHQVIIRSSEPKNNPIEVLVGILVGTFSEDGVQAIRAQWETLGVTGLVVCGTDRVPIFELGNTNIPVEVEGHTFNTRWDAFQQANRFLTADLVKVVMDAADIHAHHRIWDLYGGAGLFAFAASNRTSNEIVSVDTALSGHALAGFPKQLRFVQASVGDFLSAQSAAADVIICDPPRAGLSPDVIVQIGRLRPKTVVLVSCQLDAFSRDAKRLISAGYHLDWIQPVDMFAHTVHLEVVGRFTL
ncbi:class I SAM-dependent RNA methyltransferase [bacterium]|nr:class I SAM-dependent RNA methyltransferase [bacterium]